MACFLGRYGMGRASVSRSIRTTAGLVCLRQRHYSKCQGSQHAYTHSKPSCPPSCWPFQMGFRDPCLSASLILKTPSTKPTKPRTLTSKPWTSNPEPRTLIVGFRFAGGYCCLASLSWVLGLRVDLASNLNFSHTVPGLGFRV